MLHAWISGKQTFKRLAIIILAASVASVAAAQEVPKEQVSPTRTIILPQTIVAGTPATLAVLDSTGRLVAGVALELSGGKKVITDATGRARFVAPGEAGKLTAKISGQEVTASSTVESIPGLTSELSIEGAAAAVQVVSYPHVLALHDRFTIDGTGFRGDADSNHVFLADQPCLVVASSPVSLIVLPGPRVPIGAINLRLSIAGHDTPQVPVSAVLLEFSAPTEAPAAGTQGKIILSVRGSADPLSVEVWNGSPEIIKFPRGRVQRLTTSGGEKNATPVELRFLAAGDYIVTARLNPADSASPAPEK